MPQSSAPTTKIGRKIRLALIPAIRIIVVSLSRASRLTRERAAEQRSRRAGRASRNTASVGVCSRAPAATAAACSLSAAMLL